MVPEKLFKKEKGKIAGKQRAKRKTQQTHTTTPSPSTDQNRYQHATYRLKSEPIRKARHLPAKIRTNTKGPPPTDQNRDYDER